MERERGTGEMFEIFVREENYVIVVYIYRQAGVDFFYVRIRFVHQKNITTRKED